MVYNSILDLEAYWSLFNREPLTSAHLLQLADRLGIITLEDHSIAGGAAYLYRNHRFIAYDPHQTETNLILSIGHEIGHFALGHIRPGDSPLAANVLSKAAGEREAGIIGFLFWMPTIELCKMEHAGRLDLEEVYKFSMLVDGDLSHDQRLRFCYSRIRIFCGFRRVLRSCPVPQLRQKKIPFRQTQLGLPFGGGR